MASSQPILAVDEDIDEHIRTYCRDRPSLTETDVIRDIARIVCIVGMVRDGKLDGEKLVLAGGMAMRCLDSARMSVYDADTASRAPFNPSAMAAAISHDEEDIEIVAGEWEPGNQLTTFKPVEYDARFSQLAGAQDEFSLSVSDRGVESAAEWMKLNHRYPFPLLADEDEKVPIMDPDEILAEKTVSWWLFGHAKHFNDIAFLAFRLHTQGRVDADRRTKVRGLIEKKLEVNRKISLKSKERVDALTAEVRRQRLAKPFSHVDEQHDFATLSYLLGKAPRPEVLTRLVDDHLVPLLFD